MMHASLRMTSGHSIHTRTFIGNDVDDDDTSLYTMSVMMLMKMEKEGGVNLNACSLLTQVKKKMMVVMVAQ